MTDRSDEQQGEGPPGVLKTAEMRRSLDSHDAADSVCTGFGPAWREWHVDELYALLDAYEALRASEQALAADALLDEALALLTDSRPMVCAYELRDSLETPITDRIDALLKRGKP